MLNKIFSFIKKFNSNDDKAIIVEKPLSVKKNNIKNFEQFVVMPDYRQGMVGLGNSVFVTASSYHHPDFFTKVDNNINYFLCEFDIKNFVIKKYFPAKDTYDSSPCIISLNSHRKIVCVHEHIQRRTVAFDCHSGKKLWSSEKNQPGSYFLGHSFINLKKNSGLLLSPTSNGLVALNILNGKTVFKIPAKQTITPAIDSKNQIIFMSSSGFLSKINAIKGKIIKQIAIEKPNTCISWNNLFLPNKELLITYWYEPIPFGSAIRVFNSNLELIWEKLHLPLSKKFTLCSNDNFVFTGCGDRWQRDYYNSSNKDWKNISAYNVQNGNSEWKIDLNEYDFESIMNLIIYKNKLLALSTGFKNNYLFIIDINKGILINTYGPYKPQMTCAPSILHKGYILKGDTVTNSVLAIKLPFAEEIEWSTPFGFDYNNTMCF